jgi:AraC-like DNA-binding protein
MSTQPDRLPITRRADVATASAYALYRQQSGAPLKQLYIQQPLLIVVRRGAKIMTIDKLVLTAGVGDAIIASAGVFATVVNTPQSGGLYEADLFAFGTDLVPPSQIPTPGTQRFGSFAPPPEFMAACASARDALMLADELPPRVVSHRVGELLAWACEYGLCPTLDDPQQLPIRVRTIVARDPARDWRVADIASTLAMSEPTLRRHLAAEGTSASDIIADVRLSRALAQLQSTTIPITEIAADAGYDSPSRFAARFRARFGVSPGEIRVKRSQIDRNSTELDRSGVAAE